MDRTTTRRPAAGLLALIGLATLAAATARADGLDPDALRATQLAVTLGEDDRVVKFRATALTKAPGELLILTAAHCMSADDQGRELELRQGDRTLRAKVLEVVRNPAYRKGPDGEIPGCDNAFARLSVDPDTAAPFLAKLATAILILEAVPHADGQIVPIHSIDQFDRHQTVRAGNFSNPKWLEWGPTYRPIPGDSGSGVFILRAAGDGSTRPILIGVVTDRSARGGGASILCRRHPWVAGALPAPVRR